MPGVNAIAIYEAHLKAASQAALSGDFAAIMATFALPSQIVLADREVVLASPEELGLALEDYAHRLQAEGVIEEREWCTAATAMPGIPALISGSHITEWVFADGRPPHRFGNQMVLMCYPEGWKLLWLRSDLAAEKIDVLSADFVAAQAKALAKWSQA
jgi:hypothetical protein